MNKYSFMTMILLIMPVVLLGQRINPPGWIVEEINTPFLNHTEVFAEAFKDPNILIGIFEYPNKPSDTVLTSGEFLLSQSGYGEASIRYNLSALHLVKSIKGSFPEPVVVVCGTGLAPIFEGRPLIPSLNPINGSTWVLALKKTSHNYRIDRFGKDMDKYSFLNDGTMFVLFRFGYGALCLKWPQGKDEPYGLMKINDNMVDDLEAIEKVMLLIRKNTKSPGDMSSIDNTSMSLKNNLAKSIFELVKEDKNKKVQDTNDKSSL